MHILLVNDDGIHAPGIRALCDACLSRGHTVTVCAPHTERSANSHKITLAEPIYVQEVEFNQPNVRAWSISGTPADCVRIGLYELVDSPVDAIISGINNGHNAGMAVHYSGTIAAAREGALNHIPSVASSVSFKRPDSMLHYLANLTVQVAEAYAQVEGAADAVLSINAPGVEPEALLEPVVAPLSTAGFRDRYIRRESPRAGTYFWLAGGAALEESDQNTDVAYLDAGHITFTRLGNPCGGLDPAFVSQFLKPNA